MTSSDPDSWCDRIREGIRSRDREEPGDRPELGSIGRYDLERRLGEGASAVVYLARDRELGRTVAVKVLRDTMGAGQVRERFQREARVAAGFSHPNVVSVHDAGSEDGRLFLVMEFVDGEPFTSLLAQKRDMKDLVRILSAAASGVASAHARGIIHRDLKPANILVPESGHPKVADFGLAHIIGSDAAMTRTGAVLGTPLYMAPEQVRGQVADLSPRTDIYALGAILYEVLTGKTPHAGATVTEIYGRIMSDEPVPPRRLNPSAPRDLETVALKAIEKDPGRRYSSAEEFGRDLDRWIAGEPVLAKPESTAGRLGRRALRHRAVLIPVAIVAVLASVWAGWSLRQVSELEAYRTLESARPEVERLAQAWGKSTGDAPSIRAAGEELRKRVESAIASAPRRPEGQVLLGRLCEIRGSFDGAEDAYRAAIRIDPKYPVAHFRLGKLLMERSFLGSMFTDLDRSENFEGGKRLIEEAVSELETAEREGLEDALEKDLSIALLAYCNREFAKAKDICLGAGERFGTRPGMEDFLWLAGVFSSGEPRIEAFSRVIELQPRHRLARFCRAIEHQKAKRHELAIEDFNAALTADPRLVPALSNRGSMKRQLGDVDGAIADFTAGLELQPANPVILNNRGIALKKKGDLEGAMKDFDRALELRPGLPDLLLNRALLWKDKGDRPRALADVDLALKNAPPEWGPRAGVEKMAAQWWAEEVR